MWKIVVGAFLYVLLVSVLLCFSWIKMSEHVNSNKSSNPCEHEREVNRISVDPVSKTCVMFLHRKHSRTAAVRVSCEDALNLQNFADMKSCFKN
jgi:hypothetical protein